MRLTSAGRTLSILIASPGLGFVLAVAEHAWFFDRDGRVRLDVLPDAEMLHRSACSPEFCPGCSKFVAHDWPGKPGSL